MKLPILGDPQKQWKSIKRQLNTRNLVVVGVVVLILSITVGPLIPVPEGMMNAGFMFEGEKLSTDPLLAFVNPAEEPVDGIYVVVIWTIQGENVDWSTFQITNGRIDVELWNVWSPERAALLDTDTFQRGPGEMYATAPDNSHTKTWLLGADDLDLESQPWSDADEDRWILRLHAYFIAEVDDNLSDERLSFEWDGYCEIVVGWKTGDFTGSGVVKSAWN